MKIYLWDNGWRGASFYIGNSKEEAIEFFKERYGKDFKSFNGYTHEEIVVEHDIFHGLIIETQGD